jgi:hypothetical protein
MPHDIKRLLFTSSDTLQSSIVLYDIAIVAHIFANLLGGIVFLIIGLRLLNKLMMPQAKDKVATYLMILFLWLHAILSFIKVWSIWSNSNLLLLTFNISIIVTVLLFLLYSFANIRFTIKD